MRSGMWLWLGMVGSLPAFASAQAASSPSPQRQQALVRMVRQDCGSCHGMQLTGGLGPALTPQALSDKPVASLAATIFHGRPGTPMPGWRAMLSEADASWIAAQLVAGFPAERSRTFANCIPSPAGGGLGWGPAAVKLPRTGPLPNRPPEGEGVPCDLARPTFSAAEAERAL